MLSQSAGLNLQRVVYRDTYFLMNVYNEKGSLRQYGAREHSNALYESSRYSYFTSAQKATRDNFSNVTPGEQSVSR